MVDSTKAERLEEAKLELLKICKTHKHSQIPVLILANKQDLPLAIDVDKIETSLMHRVQFVRNRTITIIIHANK